MHFPIVWCVVYIHFAACSLTTNLQSTILQGEGGDILGRGVCCLKLTFQLLDVIKAVYCLANGKGLETSAQLHGLLCNLIDMFYKLYSDSFRFNIGIRPELVVIGKGFTGQSW